MLEKLHQYALLMRLDKPVGIYLLLFPTLSAIWMAQIYNGHVQLSTVIIFTLGCILTRSLGCVINDYFDKDFDKYVLRTSNRPLVINPKLHKEALYLCIFLLLISALLVIIFLNLKTFILAIISALIAVTYPLFKRFFSTPQAYLGIAFSMGIPMGFTAQNIPINWIMYLLLIANIFLVFAYDTIYAMVDKNDDLKIKLKTSAIFLGKYDILVIAVCYLIYLIITGFIGWFFKADRVFWLVYFVMLAKILLDLYKIKDRLIDKCFAVFKSNQYNVILNFICYLLLFSNIHNKIIFIDDII